MKIIEKVDILFAPENLLGTLGAILLCIVVCYLIDFTGSYRILSKHMIEVEKKEEKISLEKAKFQSF